MSGIYLRAALQILVADSKAPGLCLLLLGFLLSSLVLQPQLRCLHQAILSVRAPTACRACTNCRSLGWQEAW